MSGERQPRLLPPRSPSVGIMYPTVSLPKDYVDSLCRHLTEPDLRRFFERFRSGLAGASGILDTHIGSKIGTFQCDAPRLMTLCSTRYGASPLGLTLVDLQAEQSLTFERETLPMDYRLETVAVPDDYKDAGPTEWLSRVNGQLSVTRMIDGELRMVKACGYGVPDKDKVVPWRAWRYLGFDRQIYANCRRTQEWRAAFSPDTVVKLYPGSGFGTHFPYPIPEEARAFLTGLTPAQAGGQTTIQSVQCADWLSFKWVAYTPHMESFVTRYKIGNKVITGFSTET